jgi:MFS family permease
VLVRGADEFGSYLPVAAFGGFSRDLGIDYGAAGLIFVAMAVGGLAASPLGVLVDHRSRRALASLGALGYAVALAGFATSRSLPALLAAAAMLGASSDVLIAACEVALVDVAGDRLERELSRTNLLGSLGDLAGPGLFVVVGMVGGSWRLALWVGAVGMAVYAAWLASLPFPLPARGPGDAAPGPTPSAWRGALGLLADPAVWWLALLAVLFAPLDEPFLGFLVAFLADQPEMSPVVGQLAATALVLGGVVTYVVLVRRPPGRRALGGAAVVLAVGASTIALSPWAPVVVGAALAFGSGGAVFWVAYQGRLLRLRPGRPGSVTAVVGILEQPAVLIPVAIGALADRAGLEAAMLAFAAVPAVLAAVVRLGSRLAPPTPPRIHDRPGSGGPASPAVHGAGAGTSADTASSSARPTVRRGPG